MNDKLLREYNVDRIIQNPNQLFNRKIESVQYNAALVITRCVRGTSSEKLNNELGLLFLYDRRAFRRMYLYYKLQNNLTPAYLSKQISPDRSLIYNLRRARQVSVKSRTGKYKSSFFRIA